MAMRVYITRSEINSCTLGDSKLLEITNQFNKHGFVILCGIVDKTILDKLRNKLEEDTAFLLSRINWDSKGQFFGHISQAMPISKEHIYSDIVKNPMIIQITRRILGKGLHCHFYNCNANIPGSGTQPLHRDAPYLDPDPINPTISVIVNIPTIDVKKINGATEVWPGTHRILGSTRISEEAQKDRLSIEPPIRLETLKGDVILRDPRLWHRGVPNKSDKVRHLIAMVHSKWFYQNDVRLRVSKNALNSFNDSELITRLEMVPDDYDYLSENLKTI
jgi:ectoine hydroxylase-related dioxygenase (phytanoyl-CoA dioxygenase family)